MTIISKPEYLRPNNFHQPGISTHDFPKMYLTTFLYLFQLLIPNLCLISRYLYLQYSRRPDWSIHRPDTIADIFSLSLSY
jgi:hypothetical protein